MIPYGRQDINAADISAVAEVLRSNFLTQGPAVPVFERAVADRCSAAHAIAVSNATAALHLACMALGIGPGGLVWTSPITFVASANCALYCGAEVDFVDIDPHTYNMSAAALAAKLQAAELANRLPDAVIPVHLAGQSCDMEAIHSLAKRYGFRVIEDASHAVGAEYQGQPVGNCRYSDIAIFSFHPVKIVTTGEGGMAVTNDPELADRIRLLRSHGITRDQTLMEEASHGAWYYEQIELGFNYRLTDIQAALGTSQMLRLDEFVGRRRMLAGIYDEALADLPLTVQTQAPGTRSSYHLYIIRLTGAGMDRRASAFWELRARGIGVNLHYIPVYQQPFYRRLGFRPGLCPEAEGYYREAISLPLHPSMSEADVSTVISAVKAVTRT